jgi:hypothetical protein
MLPGSSSGAVQGEKLLEEIVGHASFRVKAFIAWSRIKRDAAFESIGHINIIVQVRRDSWLEHASAYNVYFMCSSTSMMAAWLPHR